MKLKTIFAAALLLPLLTIYAGAEFGASGWGIFRKIHSAQFSGISSASPMKTDLSGALYNPAMLAGKSMREVLLISEQGLAQDKFGSIIYGEPIRKGMIAAAFAYYDAGTAELNWIENDELKTESVTAQKDIMGMLSFQQRPFKSLSWGISIKAASSELAQRKTAYCYAADVGLLLIPVHNFSISLAAQNVGIATKFLEKANPLPTAGYLGLGYCMNMRSVYVLSTAGVTYLVNDEKSIPEAGIEIGFGLLSLNAGYRSIAGDLNLHLGLQVALKELVFGYAFLPAVDLDSVHRISVSYKFKTSFFETEETKTSKPALLRQLQARAIAPVKRINVK